MTTYGYIRVSTMDQNLDRQYDSMHAAGLDDIHTEFFSDFPLAVLSPPKAEVLS